MNMTNVYRRLEVEARVGIEPTHKGFADLSLTAWVPRLCFYRIVFCQQNPEPAPPDACLPFTILKRLLVIAQVAILHCLQASVNSA